MTLKILLISSGYETIQGTTYPIRLAQAFNSLKSIKITLLCQNYPDDHQDMEVYCYPTIINMVYNQDIIMQLIAQIGTDFHFIIAGSDSVIECSSHLAKAMNIPIFGYFMGFPIGRMAYPIFQNHYYQKIQIYNSIDHVFVPSYQTYERASNIGLQNSTTVISLGVEDYSKVPVMELPKSDKKTVVMVSRDASHKNVEDYLMLAKLNPGIKFIWICNEIIRRHIFLATQDLSNLDVVQADDVQKISLIKAADLFFCPFDDEGYMLTVMEALACGTRILVKDSPLAMEVLWPYMAEIVFYKTITSSLGDIIIEKHAHQLRYCSIMLTVRTILEVAIEHLKKIKADYTFKGGLSSPQLTSTLYDFTYEICEPIWELRGDRDPYHPAQWKYHFTSQHITGKRVCDLGFGEGQTSIKMLNDEYTVLALDISKKMVDKLTESQRKFIKSGKLFVEWFDATVPTIFDDDNNRLLPVVNTVICEELLEHVLDPSIVIQTAIDLADDVAIFTTPIGYAADDVLHLQHFTEDDLHTIFAEFDYEYLIKEIGRPDYVTEPSHFMIVMYLNRKRHHITVESDVLN